RAEGIAEPEQQRRARPSLAARRVGSPLRSRCGAARREHGRAVRRADHGRAARMSVQATGLIGTRSVARADRAPCASATGDAELIHARAVLGRAARRGAAEQTTGEAAADRVVEAAVLEARVEPA